MCIKNALIGILFLLLPYVSFSQIKVDDVGDGWKGKVDSALALIKEYDPRSYEHVIENCDHITYWLGSHSTSQYPSSVVIAVQDMKINSINNIACIIVHETVHLKLHTKGVDISGNREELIAYTIERSFAERIPNIEPWILTHIDNQIKLFTALVKDSKR
jgi:hypothetical protein